MMNVIMHLRFSHKIVGMAQIILSCILKPHAFKNQISISKLTFYEKIIIN